jgi:hypothetical protein
LSQERFLKDKIIKTFENYIAKFEEKKAQKEVPNKDKATFEFGLDKLSLCKSGDESQKIDKLKQYSQNAMADRLRFFEVPQSVDPIYESNNRVILKSALETEEAKNNYIHLDRFASKSSDQIVLILPFWNCENEGLNPLAKAISKFGISSAAMTLPYHGDRMPGSMNYAEGMFSPNIGLTIRSIRQAVMDVRATVKWLKMSGYKRVDLMGVSMGSMIAKIVSILEKEVHSLVACLGGSHIANFSREGIATEHIQREVSKRISFEDLETMWSIVSPISHLKEGLINSKLRQLCITAKYDQVVPEKRGLEYIQMSNEKNIETEWLSLPCGHYSFSNSLVTSYSFFQMMRFLKRS